MEKDIHGYLARVCLRERPMGTTAARIAQNANAGRVQGVDMEFNWIELFGTAASVIVAASLTMKNIKRLRVLNGVGALCFAVYGFLIGSLPVWVLNGFIVAIDAYYLWRMEATKDRFDVIEIDPKQSPYVRQFLAFYEHDIARFQPEFRLEAHADWMTELILRDLNPVSIIIYRKLDASTIEIGLDYAVPSYRDFKSAEFYFKKAAQRIAAGQEIVFVQRTASVEHQRYLERLGFALVHGGPGLLSEYRKTMQGA